MKSAKPMIPVPASELERFTDQSTKVLLTARWRPGRLKSASGTGQLQDMTSLVGGESQTMELGQIALSVGNNKGLPNEDGVHLMHTIRRGMQTGLFVSESYEKQVGLDELLRKNRSKELNPQQVTEFQQKNTSSAAVLLFCVAYYGLWKLGKYKTDEVSKVPMELPLAPEVSFSDPPAALQCFTFYMGKCLESDKVKTGPAAVKMATIYLQRVIEEVKLRVAANAFFFIESFVGAAYKLEDEDFSVSGFEADLDGGQVSAAFSPVRFDEIVGNREAKHNALRGVQRLICYDLAMKMNPYLSAFGDMPRVRMGKGIPGTGKTLQIRAMVTLLAETCEKLGIPYLFWPMPKDMGSEYQSVSARKMVAWTQPMMDQTKIIYANIDDAENIVKSREGNNVSEMTEGMNSALLTFTEGASTVYVGNWLLDIYTNLPEKIDQAILSRIQERFDVNGAQTVEDFLDQDYLWFAKLAKNDKSFVDMKDPKGYVYMANQGKLTNLTALYDGKPVDPSEGTLRRIFEEVRKEHALDEHMFYAKLFYRMRQEFPKHFSSRDVRNIQTAINNRRMDFDLPDEWFEKRDTFVGLPYDRKVEMLLDRQRESLKGQTLQTVRLQETVRYLNVSLSIPENARRRDIEQRRDDIIRNFDARKEAEILLVKTGRVRNEGEAKAA